MNTAGNIQVKLGDKELQTVKTLSITQRINDHVQVRISGTVNPEDQDSYVTYAESDTILSVNQIAATGTVCLFKGLVTKVTVEAVAGIYTIQIEGASFSYILDTELKTRSYQDQNMTYQELLQEILSTYQKADFSISSPLHQQKLEQFVFQYQETDWDFLKRMASRHNVGLVPDRTVEGIYFSFGNPDHGKALDLSNEGIYQLHKNFGAYREKKANTIAGLEETDCWIYELTTPKLLEVGQSVKFKEKSLFVLESIIAIEGDLLKFYAGLATAGGLKQKQILNEQIIGIAREGIVIDVQNDRVKVDFNVDRNQKRQLTKEKAFWFPYATPYTASGNTGWYWMPELGDSIKVYFPSNREHQGVAMDAIRRHEEGSDRLQKPDQKYIRTVFEQEFRFDNQQLAISTNEGKMRICLDAQDGIKLTSEKEIDIESIGDISINCDHKMEISANQGINLECKESKINITNKGLLDFKGTEVKKEPQ